MTGTRRERILAVLAEHPEGVPTPMIAEAVDPGSQPRRMACWETLQAMERRGEVARVPSLGPVGAVQWRLVPERERTLYRARYKAAMAWNRLTPEDRAEMGITPAAFAAFLDRFTTAGAKR